MDPATTSRMTVQAKEYTVAITRCSKDTADP
jgi:hypothetical protein